jgi:hypothetical protein
MKIQSISPQLRVVTDAGTRVIDLPALDTEDVKILEDFLAVGPPGATTPLEAVQRLMEDPITKALAGMAATVATTQVRERRRIARESGTGVV